LSTKKIIKKTVTSTLVLVILSLIVYGLILAALFSDGAAGSWLLVATGALVLFLVLLISLTYWYQKWYYAVYFYDLTSDYIIIKKGPITPQEITMPYERIQDVYVDQDLLDRMFGLYDVHLSTATVSSGMAAHIDGVEKQAAEGLRAALLQTVSERIGKKNIPHI
jgi:putative membrane protein